MSRTGERTDADLLAASVDRRRTPRQRQDAFHLLVDRYERRVYAIAYRYFGDRADAEDAAQEAFLRIARRAAQFRGEAAVSSWIYRITVNTCHDLARRRARRPQVPMEDLESLGGAVVDPGPSPEALAEAGDLAARLQAALLTLDETSRTLMILCTLEGLTYAEAARIVEVPVGTAKSRVHRARAALAKLLDPGGERPS